MQPWFPAVSSKGQRINVFTSVNTLAAVRKRAFTPGNTETQVAENKRVDRRELPVAQQFPVGDDVSAYNRCEAARVYAVGHHSVFFQMAQQNALRQRGDRRPEKRAGAGPCKLAHVSGPNSRSNTSSSEASESNRLRAMIRWSGRSAFVPLAFALVCLATLILRMSGSG